MSYKVILEFDGLDLSDDAVLQTLLPGLPEPVLGIVDGRILVTILSDSNNPIPDVVRIARLIEERIPGARACRVDEELVGISDIAKRIGVSREAVRSWVTGFRGPGDFPSSRGSIGGGKGSRTQRVWAWAEVNKWLGENLRLDDEYQYLNRRQVAALNACFAQMDLPAGWERQTGNQDLPSDDSYTKRRPYSHLSGSGAIQPEQMNPPEPASSASHIRAVSPSG